MTETFDEKDKDHKPVSSVIRLTNACVAVPYMVGIAEGSPEFNWLMIIFFFYLFAWVRMNSEPLMIDAHPSKYASSFLNSSSLSH